jgi:hypothetical protein
MMDINNGSKRNGKDKFLNLLVPSILAAIGTSGGIYIALGTPVGQDWAPHDPWTGEMAEEAQRVVNSRLGKLEDHVRNHPDVGLRVAISNMREELSASKAKQEVIIKNQDRILDKLDKL